MTSFLPRSRPQSTLHLMLIEMSGTDSFKARLNRDVKPGEVITVEDVEEFIFSD